MSVRLYLDSRQASNDVFSLTERISGTWKLLSFACTNNIYNVTDNNNKIYFNENGVDLVATLTNGYYELNDMQTNVTTALNASAAGTITSTLDTNQNKMTVTDTLNFYFTFGSNTMNSARKLLGFSEVDGVNALSQTSDIVVDLNTDKNIFVSVDENSDRNVEGVNFFRTSLVICGKTSFGETMRYVNVDNFDQEIKVRNTKKLTFSFHDLNNNVVELNSDYSIIFEKCNN